MMTALNLDTVHTEWRSIVEQALQSINPDYMANLEKNPNWLPGKDNIFNAFKQSLNNTQYILFGESPYPRLQSANGFAFWDNAVDGLWAEKGMSKEVNRATSLRNLIKMLLVARGDLKASDCSQQAIKSLDKANYIQTLAELFNKLIEQGFLLLNASLVLSERSVNQDAKAWRPFMASILQQLTLKKLSIKLILLGNIAKQIDKFDASRAFSKFYAEHPYNISFIQNPEVLEFFQPFDLLRRN